MMELPPSNQLHPPDWVKRHESDFRERLGHANYERRISKESKVNPSSPYSLLKFAKTAVRVGAIIIESIALTLCGKYGRARAECKKVRTTHHDFKVGNTGKSISLLHLSDLHIHTDFNLVYAWLKAVESLEYDLVVVTGDFVNAFQLLSEDQYECIRKLTDALSAPIYAVLGNHDCIYSVPALEELGMRILLNESETVRVKNAQINISGSDDSHYFKSNDFELISKRKSAETDLSIFLTHAPKYLNTIAKDGYDLCLAGHTHGGQIRTKSLKPLLKNGNYAPNTIFGEWEIEGMKGYTSVGMGTGFPRFRLNCTPEIALHRIEF